MAPGRRCSRDEELQRHCGPWACVRTEVPLHLYRRFILRACNASCSMDFEFRMHTRHAWLSLHRIVGICEVVAVQYMHQGFLLCLLSTDYLELCIVRNTLVWFWAPFCLPCSLLVYRLSPLPPRDDEVRTRQQAGYVKGFRRGCAGMCGIAVHVQATQARQTAQVHAGQVSLRNSSPISGDLSAAFLFSFSSTEAPIECTKNPCSMTTCCRHTSPIWGVRCVEFQALDSK